MEPLHYNEGEKPKELSAVIRFVNAKPVPGNEDHLQHIMRGTYHYIKESDMEWEEWEDVGNRIEELFDFYHERRILNKSCPCIEGCEQCNYRNEKMKEIIQEVKDLARKEVGKLVISI